MIPYSTRKPIKKSRSKPRFGRLKGEALAQLRRDCWVLDAGLCRECGRATILDGLEGRENTFEMAHIKGKRMHGDSTDQVKTNCHGCHTKFHRYGPTMTKPVPAKVVPVAVQEGSK